MRSPKLFAAALFALALPAFGSDPKAVTASSASTPTAWGSIRTTTSSAGACAWTVDGKSYGTNNGFTTTLSAGFHPVTCSRASDGFVSTQNVTVIEGKTTDVRMWLPAPSLPPPVTTAPPAPPAQGPSGQIVAVSVGASCAFAVNGAAKGTSAQLKISVPPGTYSVSCRPTGGPSKTRSVIIKPGETSMAMFTWE